MTRINTGVNPSNLTNEHLLAEHREIKRICSLYWKRRNSSRVLKPLPSEFTLGKGHVLFFIDKPVYTLARYLSIHDECLARGFDVTDYSEQWQLYKDEYPHMANLDKAMASKFEFLPAKADWSLVSDRIIQRLTESTKQFHYIDKQINREEAIELIRTSYRNPSYATL